MTRCRQVLRFIVGLAMLVAGVAVLGPLAADMLACGTTALPTAELPSVRGLPPHAIGHAIPDSRVQRTLSSGPDSYEVDRGERAGMTARPTPVKQVYEPPVPPAPLSPETAILNRSTPSLDTMYRSTLAVPPPPLLDAHGPPPLAPGWHARTTVNRPQKAPAHSSAVPATYRVQDGDDLTSLAIRLYGQPAAAAAILAANADRITDPRILPIGITLRLPPPWTITAGQTPGRSPAVEPAPGMDRGPVASPSSLQRQSAPFIQPWLDQPHAGAGQ